MFFGFQMLLEQGWKKVQVEKVLRNIYIKREFFKQSYLLISTSDKYTVTVYAEEMQLERFPFVVFTKPTVDLKLWKLSKCTRVIKWT